VVPALRERRDLLASSIQSTSKAITSQVVEEGPLGL
jgi:hypothetical protein